MFILSYNWLSNVHVNMNKWTIISQALKQTSVMWCRDHIIIHILVHNNRQMVHTSPHAINHSRFSLWKFETPNMSSREAQCITNYIFKCLKMQCNVCPFCQSHLKTLKCWLWKVILYKMLLWRFSFVVMCNIC